MERIALGADIGGSHITCQLFDLEKNKPIEGSKNRMPVDSRGRKEEILDSWSSAISKIVKETDLLKIAGIGFAMPGPFDYRNGIAWFEGVQKFENLYGVNISNEIRSRLQLPEDLPVRFLNDASCFAIGEAWMGKASQYERILALTLGTGFGTTFIYNRLPVAGKEGIPGDGFLYHIPFKESIADDYFSTRWFLKEYNQKTGLQIDGVKKLATISEKDGAATEIFHEFGRNLGNFLVPWITRFGAGCLVMGGNISQSYSLFEKNLLDTFTEKGIELEIYPTELDETAALYGSAKLCDEPFYQQLINAKII